MDIKRISRFASVADRCSHRRLRPGGIRGKTVDLLAPMRPPVIVSPIRALFSACHSRIGLTIIIAPSWWTDLSG